MGTDKIANNLERLIIAQQQELITRLQFLAEKTINAARKGQGAGIEVLEVTKSGTKKVKGIAPDYADQTGNLRSSVGYNLYFGDQIINSDFGDFSETGKKEGEAFAFDISAKLKGAYRLVFVAGMEYAKQVEDRGYRVLTGYVPTNETLQREVFSKLKI